MDYKTNYLSRFLKKALLLVCCVYISKPNVSIITHTCLSFIALRGENNWAVIVSTSRYWYNYRHNTNALAYYNFLKKNGFEEDKIILMLAEDVPCNPRNTLPGGVYSEKDNLYYKDNQITGVAECAIVDYKEDDVTVSNLMRVLIGKHDYYTPNRKRLLTNENSNIFIFLTGHGGDGFLKFQDFEEISSLEISKTIAEMRIQKRYKRIFIISETCQASTLHKEISSEEVYAIGCSSLGESSYSKHSKQEVGVATIDRFTYYSLRDLEKLSKNKRLPIIKFVSMYPKVIINSTPQLIYNSGKSDIKEIDINQFLFSENIPVYPSKVIRIDLEEAKDEISEAVATSEKGVFECSVFNELFLIKNYVNANTYVLPNCRNRDDIIKVIKGSDYGKLAFMNVEFEEVLENSSNIDAYLTLIYFLVALALGYFSNIF